MLKDILDEIARVEAEVAELNEKLAAIRNFPRLTQDISGAGDEDVQLQVDTNILREKCKQMKAQIDNPKEAELMSLPDNEELQFHALKEDLVRKAAQYQECFAFLNVQRKELVEDMEREEKTNEELKAVVKAAEMKLEETIHEKHTKSEVVRRLETKCSKLDKANSKAWKEMSAFLDEHYPLPDQDAFTKVKKKVHVGGVEDVNLIRLENLKPLKAIVKELMTACVDTPNDPYIVTDHQYWPPYVDLLLQVDIALRHPDDWKRVKLMPFHL
ncbi:centromere protein K-like [Mercenaria mercenaria]|uniref:centromere protein K-like n=1 Tax=Mercenaria mercenaria TaxID=6596 RepID=UPI00234E8697|nr:centromere protein K-like [Mercenaria mercenaria]